MTDSVRRALGLDQIDLEGNLIVISERHGTDANFLINTVLSKSLEKGYGVELVLFHNTFGHYHNIGMKLGYNLNVLRERGDVVVVEPMKSIVCNIEELGHDSVDASSPELTENMRQLNDMKTMPNPLKLDEKLVQHFFTPVRDQFWELKKVRENVTIIVDDITHLLDLNLSLKEVWLYSKYLISLMKIDKKIAMCILGHTYQSDINDCLPNGIVAGLQRGSQLYVAVEPLRTGHSDDISGVMVIEWRVSGLRKLFNWPERSTYLYKLLDRQIKLFTPGGIDALF
ncbi:hypothetical protein PV325_002684 [Microctonus aethiopoides]|uniref:Elongator complex protein 6 n=1 Tax=Microctonus aethiopoides TaxID=144406 RepID=A0AA39FQL3_9HYME|nr:hypothetical protein PV325_002684 [Microctonus aethiopoides]KAK0080088.1 hypothetical protein PV326_008345 [Microctonus aethiopoides]KAK0173883.1 hypothetical protein PV328_007024 [Microctonus aethiopoides]